ncbi:MAG: tyrosine-type recombinase/integrase [Gemmatimonadetes bacterium]|nr:tyrosine-type recombinase/integrase [Gemmatimonadota bacterium]MBA4160010.1 tyrosine-type recombinase/integrase [Gemmatimonadota bacterium]
MPRPKKGARIYTRQQGGAVRHYGDFRSYGAGREALIPPGETLATTDPLIAQRLFAERVQQLEEQKRGKHLLGISRAATLGSFAAEHLVKKARSGKVTPGWLEQTQKRLEAAIGFFGTGRDLASIGVEDVQRLAHWLSEQPSARGGTISAGTQRHHLNALSNLFRRAQSEGLIRGVNPVAALMEKPTPARGEARWLEVWEAALLLESARTYRPTAAGRHMAPYAYPLLATFLLTGGRESEVYGLEVDDVSFDRRTVTFRPNRWRRLKSRTSHRTVPLWPQLEEILRPYVFGGDRPLGRLLFPSDRTTEEQMISDSRKALDTLATRAGWKAGEIRTKVFRHSYCATRLQTLDRGAPVSPWTVAREMGHGGRDLVDRVYGHLGEIRHRAEVVEYRIDQHAAEIPAERLAPLQRGF